MKEIKRAEGGKLLGPNGEEVVLPKGRRPVPKPEAVKPRQERGRFFVRGAGGRIIFGSFRTEEYETEEGVGGYEENLRKALESKEEGESRGE